MRPGRLSLIGRRARIAVVVPAGDGYTAFASTQGMAFPAICKETISVGRSLRFRDHEEGRRASHRSGREQDFFYMRPASVQPSRNALVLALREIILSGTDVFAPGLLITSACGSKAGDPQSGLALSTGTDQAAVLRRGSCFTDPAAGPRSHPLPSPRQLRSLA